MFPRLVLLLVSLLVIVAGAAGSLPAEAASGSRDGVAWLKSQGLYESLVSRMEAARYAVRPSAGTRLAWQERGHEAGNPAQGLQAQFTDGGIAVAPRAAEIGDWRWTMRLDAYGHGDGLERLTTPAPVASGNRVEYRYGRGLTEWYVNTARGIEQGFTLDAPAPGDRTSGRPLELVLTVSGDLAPRVSGTDDEIQFTSADGKAVLGYRELKAWDARERILPSRMAIVSGHVRLIVDDREAEYPVTVDPLVFSSSKLTPINGKADDAFGFSVAISGNLAVVGAPFRETAPGVFKGAAFVFVRNNAGAWIQEAELQSSDAEDGDLFGFAVSISGSTVVVGAPGNNPGGQKVEAGAAYVFARKVVNAAGTWSEQAKITASDGATGDAFGFAVGVGGDIVVVGAPDHNPGCKPLAGKAYIHLRHGVTWTEKAKLTGSADAGDRFGYAVAISETGVLRTVVVGAPAVSTLPTVPSTAPGRVSVFFGLGASWPKQADLLPNPNDLQDGDAFGFSVGLSEDTVVVGAPGHSIPGAAQGGASYVFVRSGATWSQQATLTASDELAGALFGSAVDIDDDMLVVGAPSRPPTAFGRAYVFTRTDTTWVELTQQLKADPPASFQFFGFAVAVRGTNIAVGAPFHALGSGAGPAYVFAPTVSFAGLWMGLANSGDVGLRLDVRAEVFKGAAKVAEGQIDDVSGGDSGFDNAILQTIPLSALSAFTSYTKVTISARVTCSGPGPSVGVARLWYNGKLQDTGPTRDAGSRVELAGLAREFLRKIGGALRLAFTAGASKQFIDTSVDSAVACRPPGAPPTDPDRPFTEVGAFIF